MIQVPPNANVVVMHESINFRNGIEGTAAIARTVLEKEPMDGAFFVFRLCAALAPATILSIVRSCLSPAPVASFMSRARRSGQSPGSSCPSSPR